MIKKYTRFSKHSDAKKNKLKISGTCLSGMKFFTDLESKYKCTIFDLNHKYDQCFEQMI